MSKSLETILTKRKNQLLEFSNASGDDSQMERIQQEVDDIQGALLAAKSSRDTYQIGVDSRCKLAQEDSEKDLRKGSYGTFYNNCVKPSDNPCLTQNETGRKDRYQIRLSQCRGYYKTLVTKIALVSTLENDLQDAKDRLTTYQQTINDAISSGLNPTQAQAQANIELALLLAEQEAANLAAEKLAEANKSTVESSPYTPFFILGGFGLAALTVYIILKKKK